MYQGLMVLLCALFAAPLFAADGERQWRFRVWLDDKKIGYHEFSLRETQEQRELRSEASFEYRLLFLKLYDYEHENSEIWNGNCLAGLESRTDANGEPYRVTGELVDDQFVIQTGEAPRELPACVMSFAYWNPVFLQQQRLLNTQNGEFVEVQVSEPEAVELEVRGSLQPAYRYRLAAGELDIQLWYSENNEWLALESEADGGRTLRYELL